MSGVDVLAVLDDFSEDYRLYIPQFHAQNRKGMKRRVSELNEARAAVAEMIAALEEDATKPVYVSLDYRNQRKDGEPEGPAWWEWRRKQLDADGYVVQYEEDNGIEHYVMPAGLSERTSAALARFRGGAE